MVHINRFSARTDRWPRRLTVGSRLAGTIAMICVVLLVGTLAGCGGGSTPARRLHTTPSPRPGVTKTTVGDIELQHLRIERPADETHLIGANVGLYVTIVHRPPRVDRLTSVTSPDATRAVIRAGASAPARPVDLRIPGRSTLPMQHADKTHLELSGLKREIQQGMVVPVTFVFEEAGSVTVNVPVQVANHPIVPSPTSSR